MNIAIDAYRASMIADATGNLKGVVAGLLADDREKCNEVLLSFPRHLGELSREALGEYVAAVCEHAAKLLRAKK